MDTIEDLHARLQGIVDKAEGRTLTDAEVTEYEGLEARLEAAQRDTEIRNRQRAYNTPVPGAGPALLTATAGKPDTLDAAFDHFLRTGQANADISHLRNAQGEGTSSAGGYLVPEGFRQRLTDRLKAFGGIANVAETVTTTTGNALPWPTLDDTSNEGEIVAEGNTFAAGADLAFGEKTLGAYSYMSGGASATPLRVSWELLQDSAFDVQALVSAKLGMRIARIQSAHLATGTGTSQPLGLIHGLAGQTVGTSGELSYDDLVAFIHAVDPAYRDGARWVFNDASLKVIEQLQDSNGDPLWLRMNRNMADPAGSMTLLDYPITIDQGMPDMDLADSGTNWGAFGNISEGYVVRRVRDVEITVNPWARAAYRQTEFTAWARMDATQQNTNAYAALAGLDAA